MTGARGPYNLGGSATSPLLPPRVTHSYLRKKAWEALGTSIGGSSSMLLKASTRCVGTRLPRLNLVLLVGITMVRLRAVSLVRAIYKIEKVEY